MSANSNITTDDDKVHKTDELEFIGGNAERVVQRIRAFQQKHSPLMAKYSTRMDAMVKDLVIEPMMSSSIHSTSMETDGEVEEKKEEEGMKASDFHSKLESPIIHPELSVHAQFLLNETLNNLKMVLGDMAQEHKHPIHHLISRCGKAIDTRFFADIGRLLKNEKELEKDPENLRHANRLILEYLMGLGRKEVADLFIQESEMSLDVPNIDNFESLKNIMGQFKECNYLPAIDWLKEHSPDRHDLLFRLQCQHVIRLLETSGKRPALDYVKEMHEEEKEKYKEELKHLMFVVMTHPVKGPHNYLFHDGRWFALEEELAHALTEYRCSLSTILNAGAKTVPSLMTLRAFLNSSRGETATLPDELPCNVPVPEQVHSSFCCPILKVQSTETNPPVRLNCGHVISTDAMNKLAQQSRNNRLKCPYCPLESVLQECKVLYF